MAEYAVHWTLGHVAEHGAHFDLTLNAWQDDTQRPEHCSVSLYYGLIDGVWGFMLIDSADRPVATDSLVTRALNRDDVIGHPLAEDVFMICDVISLKDARITELLDTMPNQMERH
jgi:hypothetical protein